MGEFLLFQSWGADFFCDLDVGACIFEENVPYHLKTLRIEQQWGTKITICAEYGKGGGECYELKFGLKIGFWVGT